MSRPPRWLPRHARVRRSQRVVLLAGLAALALRAFTAGRRCFISTDPPHHEHHGISEDVGHLASHPGLFFAEILSVVVLSLLFEMWEHWVHHRIHQARDRTAKKILAAIFKELTCLGFIGLTLFGATRCGLLSIGGADEHVLLETFETVHMIIFFLLIVLIFQAAALLHVAHNAAFEWSAWEHTRPYGKHRASLESMFVGAGYLSKVPNVDAPRGTDLVCAVNFKVYAPSLWERLKLRHDRLHSLVLWRLIRHEFLFPDELGDAPVPDAVFFSFSDYLRGCLADVVLSLVEIDKRVWFLTLALPGPVMYFRSGLSQRGFLALLCCFAWGLLSGAFLLTILLEEDLHQLTPVKALPEDARQILRYFQSTSSPELWRKLDDDIETVGIKRGAPGFRSMQEVTSPRMRDMKGFLLCTGTYKELFRILGFWQAVCVTALFTTCITSTPSQEGAALCLLTLAEWPVMLFWVVPRLVRKLTVRSSCGKEANRPMIREVTLDTKRKLLRHHLHLMRMRGVHRRAAERGLAWALPEDDVRCRNWSLLDAAEQWRDGWHKYQSLPQPVQEEAEEMFSIWDSNNNGRVEVADLEEVFNTMGFLDKARQCAASLVRLLDDEGVGTLSEEKFKAMVALSTADRRGCELQEDLEMFYELIDKEGKGKVHCHQFTEWLQKTKMGAEFHDEDIASLLYEHFSRAKPTITKQDFVEWFQALGGSCYDVGDED